MAKTVNLQEIDKPAGTAAAIAVFLQGFTVGATIEITIWEDDLQDSLIGDPKAKTVQKIGRITGEVIQVSTAPNRPPLLSLKPTSHQQDTKSQIKLLVAFPQPGGTTAVTADLRLPNTTADAFEGEFWELFATVEGEPDAVAPTTRVARVRRALSVQKGQATYSHYVGNLLRFYHDGSTDSRGSAGYYHDLVVAIGEAEEFIFIVDWSFQPHTRPKRGGAFDLASTLGALLIAQAIKHPEMLIAIDTWDHTNVGAPDAQNDNGNDELDSIAKNQFGLPRRPSNILWRMTSRTGIGFSHHQKYVVMDATHVEKRRRLRAFVGGLDITKGRFDWHEHVILPDESAAAGFREQLVYAKKKTYDDWYNAEFYVDRDFVTHTPTFPEFPRQPWHDIAVHIVGPTCWDLVREFVGRWRLNPSLFGSGGDTGAAAKTAVTDKYQTLLTKLQDPTKKHHPAINPVVYAQQWQGAGGPWAAQLLRSMAREHWEHAPPLTIKAADRTRKEFAWTVTGNIESSVQRAYIQAIGQAEEFVYIETQYFISSGADWGRTTGVTNLVARTLAQRAIERAKAGKPFHIYLVVPMFPEGDPGGASNAAQRQFQWNTILSMARAIEGATKKSHTEFLSVFFVAQWHDLRGALPTTGGTRAANVKANKRYQIYVHSKFMLVDDRYLIIGSANLNERSLNGGRDSEIALHMWSSDDSTLATCIADARRFRLDVWAEHLGPKFSAAMMEQASSAACVATVRAAASENYSAFREGRKDSSVHGHLCLWPIETATDSDSPVKSVSKAPELDSMIPDRPFGLEGHDVDAWRWHAPGKWSQAVVTFTDEGTDIAE